MTVILTEHDLLADLSGSLRKAAREFPEIEYEWRNPYLEDGKCCAGALLAIACGYDTVGQIQLRTPTRLHAAAQDVYNFPERRVLPAYYERIGWCVSLVTQREDITSFEQAADLLESLGL